MYSAISSKIDDTQNSIHSNAQASIRHVEFVFVLENGGDGEIVITNPFLTNESISEQRARSEMLTHGYRERYCSLTTYKTE